MLINNLYVCFLSFFFFKQKTAYELRISDWSSDVCSSDLLGRTEQDIQASGPQSVTVEDSMSMVHASAGRLEPASELLLSEPAIVAGQIGRASCRERVWQYV